MSTRITSLMVVCLFIAGAGRASAQVSYDGCFTPAGPVPSVADARINDSAMATMTAQGPIIIYNPAVLPAMPPQVRLFTYFHECAHVVLGHVFVPNPNMEQQADCWAVRTAVAQGRFRPQDVAIVQQAMAAAGRADWTHLPGPVRAMNLVACLG